MGEDSPYSFGAWIRRRRKALDLTREALAEQVGCAAITIRKIESDERRPSRQIAARLAECLTIPAADREAFLRAARAELAASRLPMSPPEPAPLPIPARPAASPSLRGYTLHEQIGAGGFGTVYRASQPGVGREVAIKLIAPALAGRPDFIRRFAAEADLVARLEHPHIVPLYDYWRDPAGACLVMRYVRGGSLQSQIGSPWPPERVGRLLAEVGAALDFAHRHGVIHRDIKPGNILLDADGNAYLADFGIAKDLRGPDDGDVTQDAAILGSPDYLSPEQIRDEPLTPASDIYGLGLLLYVLLAGAHPLQHLAPAERLAHHLNEPLPPLGSRRPELPAALDALIQRATAKSPAERYQDVAALLADWQRALAPDPPPVRADLPSELPTEAAEIVGENPYKGLRAFGEGDAADFFGREALTRRMVERLAEADAEQPVEGGRFLAIVGPSGSGKSSAVRAGLIPALRRGALPGSASWFIVELLPGPRPLEEIEAALLRVAVNPPEQLLGQLREDERGLLRAVKRVLPADPDVELLLVIDQFEEIFTLVESEAARAHLLASLAAAVADSRSRLRVIITLRADFYDRPLLYPAFAELVQARGELVLPLSAPELRRAIVGPAARAGVSAEPDLVAEMVRDVGEQPGALPLLQYALTELYEQRGGPAMTLAGYRAGGGVAGALARRADTIYEQLSPEQQEAARQLFLRLIVPGEGVEDTRRRVRLSELAIDPHPPPPLSLRERGSRAQRGGGEGQALSQYAAYRLLTYDRDPITREPTVEVAHEALIRSWGRLRGWLAAAREDLRAQRRLAAAAAEWRLAGRDPSFLPGGSRLAQFAALGLGDTIALNRDEREFLDTAQAAAEQAAAEREARQRRELEAAQRLAAAESARAEQQQRAAAQLRRRAFGLAGALAAALVLAATALYFGVAAERSAGAAQAASRVASSRELAAAAVSNLEIDPERSILLALAALEAERTTQASSALERAVVASRVQWATPTDTDRPLIINVLFSPDGTRVASAPFVFTSALTTTISDAASGKQLYTIPGYSGSTFWQDGKYLLTEYPPADNLTLTLWETGPTEARPISEISLPLPFAKVIWYQTTADHSLIAVSSQDNPVTVYSLTDGRAVFATDVPGVQLTNPAISPDGRLLAAVTADLGVKVWQRSDAADGGFPYRPAFGTDTYPLRGLLNEAETISFSPDGSRLAAAAHDSTVVVWDLAEAPADQSAGQTDPRLRFMLRGHTNDARFTAWSPDGSRLATSSQDSKIIIWDMASGAQELTLAGHTSGVSLLSFSPDGRRLLSGGGDGTLRLWDVGPAHELRAFQAGPATSTNFSQPMALSADGRRMIVGNPEVVAPARVYDAQTGALVVELPNGDDRSAGVALSADGRRAATASADPLYPGQSASAAPSVAVWDAESGALIRRFPVSRGFLSVALSPDGGRVAATGFDRVVWLWDVASGIGHILKQSGDTGENWPIAFSADGSRVAASTTPDNKPGYIDIWDAADGRHLLRLAQHDDRIFSLAFDKAGGRLASVSRDGTARIWDLRDGALLKTMRGHTSTVMGVAWSPDDTQIASAAYDSTIRTWDVATGQELRAFASPSGPSNLAYSPDGRLLYAASVDGIVRVYLTDLDDLIALARSRVTRALSDEECRSYLHRERCAP